MLIESLDHKGRGIARVNGKIIFIENALPGEDVDISVIKDKKKYSEAIVKNFNEKINDRENVKCPYYYKCGGCQIMHMKHNYQLSFKQNKISNIIEKYFDKKTHINPIVYGNQYNYRNKLRLQVKDKVGLYEKETNKIVDIDSCLICNSLINEKINKLKKLNLKYIKDITMRVGDNQSIVLLNSSKDVDTECINNDFDNIIVKSNKTIIKKGSSYIKIKLNNVVFQVSIESFFQVNYDIMIKMYDYVKSQLSGNNKVLDLYCGIGSISLYIKDVVSKVFGVEINKQAIIDANINKELNNCQNVSFRCSDTKDIIINDYYDTIIVDPPRAGLNKQIINELLKSDSKQIIYVSCDPLTMVRDINLLKNKYDLISITPFDMFPNTYHVECVCVLKLR